jgi:hypothetical protein
VKIKAHLAAAALVLTGCGGSAGSRAPVPGLPDLDLSAAGFNLVLSAPQGAMAKASGGDVTVEKPPNFALIVRPVRFKGSPTNAMKIFLNKVQKQVSYPLDEPDALIYEIRDSTPPEYGLKTVIHAAGADYICSSSAPKGVTFTRADVDAMLASCRSLGTK